MSQKETAAPSLEQLAQTLADAPGVACGRTGACATQGSSHRQRARPVWEMDAGWLRRVVGDTYK